MEMTCIVIVEDKAEEQEKALAAVKNAFGITGEPFGTSFPGMQEHIGQRFVLYGEKDGPTGVMVFLTSHLAGFRDRMGFLKSGIFPKKLILTDLMFPMNMKDQEKMHGIEVLVDAIEAGINVAVCSDTDHHDVPFMPSLIRVLEKNHPKGRIPVVLDSKDWDKAITLGLDLLNA
jgi:hypothetical protein